jgi:hypothetical protein
VANAYFIVRVLGSLKQAQGYWKCGNILISNLTPFTVLYGLWISESLTETCFAETELKTPFWAWNNFCRPDKPELDGN